MSRWLLLVLAWWSLLLTALLYAQPPGKGKTPQEEKVFEKYLKEADKNFDLLDQNGDGLLNEDEMPPSLRRELVTWDRNGDGLIDREEYRFYLHSRLRLFLEGKLESSPETLILEKLAKDRDKEERKRQEAEQELRLLLEPDENARPVVFRWGKLPSGLPEWFHKLDTDKDGQVGLYEWRRGGLPTEEFQRMDRNSDGLLTAEEVLYFQRQQISLHDYTVRSNDTPSPAKSKEEKKKAKKGK